MTLVDLITSCLEGWCNVEGCNLCGSTAQCHVSNQAPNCSIGLGSLRSNTCSANAWDVTFFLVSIIICRAGSTVSRPAIVAGAARVFPAPKTPLMEQSVFPSRRALMRAETAGKRCAFSDRTRGVRTVWMYCSPSSYNCSLCSSVRMPQLMHNLSAGMPAKTARSSIPRVKSPPRHK